MDADAADPMSDDEAIPRRGWVELDLGAVPPRRRPFRSKIVEDRQGTPLRLQIRLVLSDARRPRKAVLDAAGDAPAVVFQPSGTHRHKQATTPSDRRTRRSSAAAGGRRARDVRLRHHLSGLVRRANRACSRPGQPWRPPVHQPVLLPRRHHRQGPRSAPYDERPDRVTRATKPTTSSPTTAPPRSCTRPAAAGYEGAICLVLDAA